ncbi:MAG: TM0996/MTH895 family glutaredoxin-like protein [Candidatus Heimdallarchaeota archaeon]|nr:TM0996/MTH895 family glutaredoxin-like protein [Candidatus Heimdallarchaeota archaeon]MCK5047790.1 TM0996/MTH895 family glutaredoxin-like protein [Candidatus Heimdallarchaeota archaeon]
MLIEVFGTGCKKCKQLEERAQEALDELKITADVMKVTDMVRIVERGIMRTPGLAINGQIVKQGQVPSLDDMKALISQYTGES